MKALRPEWVGFLPQAKFPAPCLRQETRHSRIVVCCVLWSVISYLIITHFLFMAVKVDGESMMPTLAHGDLCVVNCLVYQLREPRAGEVVVIKDPRFSDLTVKRVIAGPSDKLELRPDGVYVNQTKVEERYLWVKGQRVPHFRQAGAISVPEGHFYVLGDNRDNSMDSRMFGSVPRHRIVGQIKL